MNQWISMKLIYDKESKSGFIINDWYVHCMETADITFQTIFNDYERGRSSLSLDNFYKKIKKAIAVQNKKGYAFHSIEIKNDNKSLCLLKSEAVDRDASGHLVYAFKLYEYVVGMPTANYYERLSVTEAYNKIKEIVDLEIENVKNLKSHNERSKNAVQNISDPR